MYLCNVACKGTFLFGIKAVFLNDKNMNTILEEKDIDTQDKQKLMEALKTMSAEESAGYKLWISKKLKERFHNATDLEENNEYASANYQDKEENITNLENLVREARAEYKAGKTTQINPFDIWENL